MIDTHSKTWEVIEDMVSKQIIVSRAFLENPDFTDHDQILIHKGRISIAKELLSLPNKNIAVITKE